MTTKTVAGQQRDKIKISWEMFGAFATSLQLSYLAVVALAAGE